MADPHGPRLHRGHTLALARTVVALYDRLAVVRTDDRIEVVCEHCNPPRVLHGVVGCPAESYGAPHLHDGHAAANPTPMAR